MFSQYRFHTPKYDIDILNQNKKNPRSPILEGEKKNNNLAHNGYPLQINAFGQDNKKIIYVKVPCKMQRVTFYFLK